MEANFSSITNALSWTLIHSLWQGGLIFIFLLGYFHFFKKAKANAKFLTTFVSLLTLFITVVVTFIIKLNDNSNSAFHSENIQSFFSNFIVIIEINNANTFTDFINTNSHQISNIWLIGTFVFLLKYLVSYFYIINIRRNNSNIDLNNMGIDFSVLCQNIGVHKNIIVKDYAEYISPFTVGFFKPFIFFPFSILNQLTTKEVECILAHELGHIKRHDYFFNTISTFIEVLLYYHPVVWWIQKKLSEYREEACDDIAINHIKDAMIYARSLLALQELLNKESHVPALGLGFINNKKSILLNRIKRMFNMTYSPINIKEKLAASLFIFLFALGITELYAYKAEGNDYSLLKNLKEIYTNPFHEMENDTIPKSSSKKKEKITILKEDGQRSIAAKIEDGEIKELKVDGKEIPKEEYDQYSDVIKELKPLEGKAFILGGDNFFPLEGLGHGFSFDNDWMKDNKKWQEKMEKWEKNHEKGMKDYEKGMKDWEKNSHAFVFPKGFNDSTLQIYQLEADSMMKLADVYRWKADSLHKFHFAFPKGFDKSLRLMLPENGFNIKIPEFNFDFPEFNFDMPDHAFKFGEGDYDLYNPEDYNKNDDLLKHKWDNNNLEEIIGKQLNRDGFLVAGKENKVELSGKHLKINGEKQPSNIWNKYKNLFERETGMPLHKDTKLVFNVEGKESKRKFKAF